MIFYSVGKSNLQCTCTRKEKEFQAKQCALCLNMVFFFFLAASHCPNMLFQNLYQFSIGSLKFYSFLDDNDDMLTGTSWTKKNLERKQSSQTQSFRKFSYCIDDIHGCIYRLQCDHGNLEHTLSTSNEAFFAHQGDMFQTKLKLD